MSAFKNHFLVFSTAKFLNNALMLSDQNKLSHRSRFPGSIVLEMFINLRNDDHTTTY